MTLLQAVTLLLALPSGLPPAHIRNAEPGYLEARVAETEQAAHVAGVEVALLAALLVHESAFDRDAVSFDSTSLGVAQLNKRGPWYRQWQSACRADMEHCQYAGILIGAQVLKRALVKCRGAYRCAVAMYRHGHVVKPRKIDTRVVVVAKWIRRRLEES